MHSVCRTPLISISSSTEYYFCTQNANHKKFSLSSKSGTLLPEFPNAKNVRLPDGVSIHKVRLSHGVVFDELRNSFGFALLRFVIGYNLSQHFLNPQSEVKPKPMFLLARMRFPALNACHIDLRFDWFIRLSASVVKGNYFGFGFTNF